MLSTGAGTQKALIVKSGVDVPVTVVPKIDTVRTWPGASTENENSRDS